MTEFDFTESIPEVTWAIKPLIPFGHFVPIIAQAGIGKSLFVESIAVHAICGMPFCQFETTGGDVLIIDQDTPTDTLRRRLKNLRGALKTEQVFKLYIESLQSYTLRDIPRVLKGYPTVKYIILDSLTSLSGDSNLNSQRDMQKLVELKNTCLTPDRVMLMTHHITEKADFSINALMTEPTNKLAMYSSLINQQADTYFIVGASANDGRLNKLYIRPVSKRETIPVKPFILDMVACDNGTEMFQLNGSYKSGLSEVEADMLALFNEVSEPMTVREVYDRMGWKHGINTVREGLRTLARLGKLSFERGKNNLFKYIMVGDAILIEGIGDRQ